MSLVPPFNESQSLWQDVITAENALRDSIRAFAATAADKRVDLMQRSLRSPGSDRAAAIRVLPYLSLADRQALLPDLVWLASWGHGLIQHARNAILSLPRTWVLERIELLAEPLLAQSDDQSQFEEFRRLLELYQQLGDPSLLRRLAERAIQHEDADVHEAGQEFSIQAVDN